MELIELLLRLLFMSLMYFGVSSEVTTSPPGNLGSGGGPVDQQVVPTPRPDKPGAGGGVRSPIVIESVDAVVMESFPMQVSLTVTGYQQDGCQFPVNVEQRREGNRVYVDIYREVEPDVMCPMVIISYEANIRLDGGFEPGSYEIRVNDFTLPLDL